MIRNAGALATTPLREALLAAIAAGIDAARPEQALRRTLSVTGNELRVGDQRYDLASFDELLVLGGGNVAGALVHTLEDLFPDSQGAPALDGLVVSDSGDGGEWVDVARGDHPLPSERNVEATRRMLERADSASASTLVLCVVGGGGSALMAAPVEAIPLGDYRETVDRLLRSGADIGAINTVRKHCSAIKGGRLAATLTPATVVGLVFSDVVGDDLGTIASGPLWPDETTYADAIGVIADYDVDVPASVREHLDSGAQGEHPETPTAAGGPFDHVDTHLIANGDTAVEAARAAVEDAGLQSRVVSTRLTGSAPRLGRRFARLGRTIRIDGDPDTAAFVCIGAGETTVAVEGDGTGGPSQSFALRAAIDLAVDPPEREIVVASVDTDGIDGASEAAGAIVDATTADDVEAARAALAANDAGGYLADRNALIDTGPTGTNVNDLYLVGVGPE